MKKIEIIVAYKLSLKSQLRSTLRRRRKTRLVGDMPESDTYKLRERFSGNWRVMDRGANSTPYKVVSFYVDSPRRGKSSVIDRLRTRTGKINFIIIAAFNSDGSMYGTTRIPATSDDDGNELTPASIKGTPVYPRNAAFMDIFSDDVTYDVDGTELSRTRPTLPKQDHQLLGWKTRIWG